MPEISVTWRGSRGPGPPSAVQYLAHARGVRLSEVEAEVTLQLQESPLLVTGTVMAVRGEGDIAAVIDQAQATSTVSNAIVQGVPVTLAGAAS